MKTIKNIALAFIGTSLTLAQTPTGGGGGGGGGPVTQVTPPPAVMPTQNIGKLRAYATSQVAGSSISVWGDSVMWSSSSRTNIYFHPQVKPSIEEAMRQLNVTLFHFKVADRTKSLVAYSELHNDGGMTLFVGMANASVSAEGALLCVGVTMKMITNVPIYVGSNVSSAYIKIGNDRVHLDVWNGYVMFPQGYAEKDGMLVLQYDDEVETREIGYYIPTGLPIPLTAVSGTVSNYLQDFQTIGDDGMTSGSTLLVGAYGYVGDDHESPVVCVKITSARPVGFGSVIYDVHTNETLENPASGGLIMPDSTETSVTLTPGQWSPPVTLQPGTYYFYPVTDKFDVPTPPIYYYGGKG